MAPSSANLTGPAPSSMTDGPFTIQAVVGTDNWRVPPSTNRASAPMVYEKIALSSFRRARVTVTAGWRALYDQAGLVLVRPARQPVASGDSDAIDSEPRWIKAGLEVVDGVRHASVVNAAPYSDWSLVPLDSSKADGERKSVTIEFERVVKEHEGPNPAMWIHLVRPDGSRQKLREVTSIFHDDGKSAEEAWMGVYTAQPIGTESKEPLEVEFKDFELITA